MPDEQIIYLDPNDELTRVREKIEEVPSRRIIMVVPQQTQLRSNVGWRLLHARARELGKEVQVISPDRQVRAVAKAAGFRVSQPQEGASTGRTRVPPTQNARGGIERKGMQRQRLPFNRGPADTSMTRRREPLVPPPLPAPEEEPTETRPPQSTWVQQENPPTRPEEPTSWQGKEDAYPDMEIVEEDAFERPFEFRIDDAQAASARPLAARPDEEEQQDPYIQDYDTARRIREAAQEGLSGSVSTPPLREQDPASAFPSSRFSTPPEPSSANPFEDDIEELSPSLLPEQRAATFAPDVHDIAPDVTDIPTDVHKIEDVEEPGGSQDFPVRQWDNEFLDLPTEDFPPPSNDTRTRGGRRSGKLQRNLDEDDPDYLPPAGQSTLIRPKRPASSGSLGTPRNGGRGAQVPPPQPVGPPARSVTTRPVQSSQPMQAPPPSRPITRSRIPAAPPPPRRRATTSARRGRITTAVVVTVLILLLLLGVGFFYYGTTATVTITVPSKTLTLNGAKLVASTTTQSKFPDSVTSQLLTYNASISGTGTASGTTKQGNSVATGSVNFTNNGTQLVTIPSYTPITTNAGNGSIAFVTTATAVILPNSTGNAPVPVPVKAQNPGSSGNVGAGTITVVPAASNAIIAQASNLTTSQVNLSVTNPNPLTGGGAAQVPTVTRGDLQSLKNSLHRQLQAQISGWEQTQVHNGDIAGKLFPNVAGSAQPLAEEQLAQVPTPGSPLPAKTFTGTLSVKVSLLVVRQNSLMAAAASQLNSAALKTLPNPYVLATQFPVTLSKVSSVASSDGKTITITLSASGLTMLRVDTRAVSAYLAGKTSDQAKSAVSNGDAGPREVEKVDIVISPGFLSILPFRSEHIHIDVMPGTPLPKG